MSYKNQINVIQLKVLHTSLYHLLHLINRESETIHKQLEEENILHLCGDEELFSLHNSLLNALRDSLADAALIIVVLSGINMSISNLDSLLCNSIRVLRRAQESTRIKSS